MVIAKDDLHGVLADGLRQIAEARHGDVTRERDVAAGVEQRATHGGHSGNARGGIFEIAAGRGTEFLAKFRADTDARLDAPCAIRIHAHGQAELAAQRAHAFDLDVGIEHAGLEFDVLESVLRDELAHLRDDALGRERLAVFVPARVVPFPAAAGVLVKWIRAEWHRIAHATTDEVAHGLADGLADEIEARGLDRRKSARGRIKRIFAGHEHRLRTRIARAIARGATLDHVHKCAGEPEGIRADELRAQFFQRLRGCLAAVRLGDAGDAVVALDFQDRAQRVRLVEAVARTERRVCNGDAMDGDF